MCVELLFDTALGTTVKVFDFDQPPRGTDLEGIPGAGDSGGPALLIIGGRAVVAGVSSLVEPGPGGPRKLWSDGLFRPRFGQCCMDRQRHGR